MCGVSVPCGRPMVYTMINFCMPLTGSTPEVASSLSSTIFVTHDAVATQTSRIPVAVVTTGIHFPVTSAHIMTKSASNTRNSSGIPFAVMCRVFKWVLPSSILASQRVSLAMLGTGDVLADLFKLIRRTAEVVRGAVTSRRSEFDGATALNNVAPSAWVVQYNSIAA